MKRKMSVEKCRANLCFAIDGSKKMSGQEFKAAKLFVMDVVTSLYMGSMLDVAAVQYGSTKEVIQSLTDDKPLVVYEVNEMKRVKGDPGMVSAMNYCMDKMVDQKADVNHFVLVGSGLSKSEEDAVMVADDFRKKKIGVSVAAPGKGNRKMILDLAGGDARQVFDLRSEDDATKLVDNIEDNIFKACKLNKA